MDNKNKYYFIGLILLVILSISAVSAEENATDSIEEYVDEVSVDDALSNNQYEHIVNDEVDAEIEIKDNNLTVHGQATDWMFVDLEYNYYEDEYDYVLDENGCEYSEYVTENEKFNMNFPNLINGRYILSLGDTEFPFTIDLPYFTNITVENETAIIKLDTNDPGEVVLFDENGEEIEDTYETIKQGLNIFEYSLPNGNYTFRTTSCKNDIEIPFIIDVPTRINTTLIENELFIEITTNKNNFKALISHFGFFKLNNGYCSKSFKNLKNGEYNIDIIIYDSEENIKFIDTKSFDIKCYNTKIAAKENISLTYGSSNIIYATINQNSEDGSAKPVLVCNGETIKGTEKKENQFAFKFNKPAGKYQVELQLDDGKYYAEPVKVNVTINKAASKVTVKKAFSTTKSYATLRAVIDDKDYMYIDEGVVNFTINGKTYSVKVKNGEAIKKIKLTKAKTYTLKATFSSKNYQTKSVSSKVVVSKAKKSYVIKIGKYSCKVSFSDYKKILDAKSWNSVFSKTYNTHKTIKVKYYTYKTKKVTYTKKKLLAHSWIKNGKVYSRGYASANIAPSGYKYAGAKIVSKGTDVKEYQIYKKTVKKKVKSKAKYKTCKVYISIDTYRWSKNHDVKAMAFTDSSYLMDLDKDYNYYSKEKVL